MYGYVCHVTLSILLYHGICELSERKPTWFALTGILRNTILKIQFKKQVLDSFTEHNNT